MNNHSCIKGEKIMIYQITAILILLIFYTFYFAKIMIQKKQSIKTNQMGMGNKSKNVNVYKKSEDKMNNFFNNK